MCGVIGLGLAVLMGLVALAFGVASIFNGLATAEIAGALLINQIVQPIGLLLTAAVMLAGGVGIGLGLPVAIRTLHELKQGGRESEKAQPLPPPSFSGALPAALARPPAPDKTAVGGIVVGGGRKRARRPVVHVDLDSDW